MKLHITKEQEKSWFLEGYAQWPWFAPEARPKTFKAMKVLFDRMPKRWQEEIPFGTIVFAPNPDVWDEAIPWFQPAEMPREIRGAFIYLSPELEKRSQASVNRTVAHEFAHAVLGHGGINGNYDMKDTGLDAEKEADLLIIKWGYKGTNSCNWRRRYATV